MKKRLLLLFIFVLFGISFMLVKTFSILFLKNPIKIGIIHSLTGDLAISEKPVADAILLAIDEINSQGGILGRLIEPLVADGKSNDRVFSIEAERLITKEKVVALFGGWTSPSRIAIKNVVEKHNGLYFYPVQFEGIELSNNVIYTSTTPNQQVIPGVTWCIEHLGNKFFLVGSDLILHEIIKDTVYAHGGTIAGEHYIPLNDKNIEPIIGKIIESKPDIILNNIEGISNLLFFNALRKKGITPEKIPTMSFSISEPELQLFNSPSMRGDYATWSYFENIESTENKKFKQKIKSLYGTDQPVSDSMEAAYYSVYLFRQAIEKAQSLETDKVRNALYNQAFNAPQGLIHIDQHVLQTWSWTRIGKIRSDKQFSIIWSSAKSIAPMAYPPTRSIEEWNNVRAIAIQKEAQQ